MEVKFKVDDNGVGYVAAIDPTTGEHRKAATVDKGQEVTLDIVTSEQIGFGDVRDSESDDIVEAPIDEQPKEPADIAGGGDEGSPEAGQDEGQTDAPTTSAASEKPLYLISGQEDADIAGGFTPSGLETPDGRTLYHFEGDTAGQSATGNADDVSVYADADDNEKPVQPAAPAEGQETATA